MGNALDDGILLKMFRQFDCHIATIINFNFFFDKTKFS